MIEIEVQNETHQTQQRMRFSIMPRIGEGIRLRERNGFWASYDILDLWYQQADYGDLWVPYIHVRMTPGEDDNNSNLPANDYEVEDLDEEEFPFTI